MARKRRVYKKAVKEEEYEFTPPEFDELEFIHKDLYTARILFVVTALAIVIGVFASFLHKFSDMWYLGALLLFLVVAAMKQFLALLRFEPDVLEGKTMIGNYALFLLLSLGVWILLINPPFA